MKASRHSVLIVEDEALVAEDLRQTLDTLGYDAFAVAASADDAIAYAAQRCPDVVLMDIRIKGARDGIETAAILRERFDVPIVFLTAHGDTGTFERATKAAPYGYLLKPVKASELRSAIEIALFRHHTERQVRVRERWFSTTLRSIADAVVAVDRAGKIAFMNPAAEGLIGTMQAEAIGRPVREVLRLFDLNEQELPETPLERALTSKATIQLPEAELWSTGRMRRTIEDTASPVVDAGELLGAVMVFRDITDRKLLQQQLELAHRLASLGTLAAGVAHEVNNPLTVVTGNAELVHEVMADLLAELGRTHPDDAVLLARLRSAIEAQSEIESSAQRIARIVADLKGFSKPAERMDTPADVARTVEWAVRATSHELKHRARVVTDLAAVPAVALEETRLEQVLVNLLVNAAHAITPGETERNQVTISARLVAEGERVVIEVRDTGCGMPAQVRDRIFDPFFTTKPVGMGTGLGLSVCHGILRSAGGSLAVDSTPGEGSVFRLSLPVARATAPAPTASALPLSAAARGRVLVVDDEELVLQTIRRALAPHHDVTCLKNAREALEHLERGDAFDVILVDLSMPDMSGMEFYERLKRSRPEVSRRVVMISGGATSSRAAEFLSLVPNARLEKPFSVSALQSMVRGMLAKPAGSAATDSVS